ncbi:MAG: hypothetical protein ACRDRZ_17970 [Pseudonocardiaceae bacterium]
MSKAGINATEIGDRMLRDSDDLLAQARNVSGGLDGFGLAGALNGCAQVWDDELESVAHQTCGAGERLLSTASTYEGADAAAGSGFDALAALAGQGRADPSFYDDQGPYIHSNDSGNLVGSHAYSVKDVLPDGRVVLGNPWGSADPNAEVILTQDEIREYGTKVTVEG